MYEQDLNAVLHALWVEDVKPLHGHIRVEIDLILLLSGATSTRPGALIESGACKGSNKCLKWEDITFLVVPNPVSPEAVSVAVAVAVAVNLVNIKQSGGKSRR